MSTLSLSSSVVPLLNRPPSYFTGHQGAGHRLTLADRLRPRFAGAFVKESRAGNVSLHLNAQEDGSLPVHGSSALVEGTVELTKTQDVNSVEVKIEGKLHIKEFGEGGTSTVKLCLDTALLWNKDSSNVDCPSSLHFSIRLPPTYTYAEKTYPLPPTYEVVLKGVPGFSVAANYSVSAIVSKENMPHINSKALGVHIGSVIVSTPFIYHPRSRPSRGIPPPLISSINGFQITPEWRVQESNLRSTTSVRPDIVTKLYTPALGVFCIAQTIPFYLTLESSSAASLAAFLPFSPTASTSGPRQVTRMQLMRQTSVDVRSITVVKNQASTSDMWRVVTIGKGTFRLVANDEKRITYSGEISINPAVKIPGFKGAGLKINDFILFSVSPINYAKSPFQELREIIPVYLSTDPFEDEAVITPDRRASISSTYKPSLDT